MKRKGAAKFNRDGCGAWLLDDRGLPCYRLQLHKVHADARRKYHLIGTGFLQALVDQWGHLDLYAGDAENRFRLNGDAHGESALRLNLSLGEESFAVFPAHVPPSWTPRMDWGAGYLTCGMSIPLDTASSPMGLDIELVGCPDNPYFLVALRLTPPKNLAAPHPITITAAMDVPSPPDGTTTAPFARDGIAIQSLDGNRGDIFLAGGSGWQNDKEQRRLRLVQNLVLHPNTPVSLRLLLGHTALCSRQWLREQFQGLTAKGILEASAPALLHHPPSGPELWMRQDALWCRAMLQNFRAPDSVTGHMVLQPAAGSARARPAHIFALCPLVQPRAPDLVYHTLVAWMRRLDYHEIHRRRENGASSMAPDATSRCRSDTPIWFLWAWAQWLANQAEVDDILLHPLDPEDREGPTPHDHLLAALAHVRDHIGTGPHGLVRLLGGDWDGILDHAGQQGAGESSLNTAVLCAALRSLADVYRNRHEPNLADPWAAWARSLAEALGEAFVGTAFLRGYTDAGKPIGAPPEEPAYLAVQAWAVLARAGTLSQREQALESILEACDDGLPTLVTCPYPEALPETLSSRALPPGHGINGAVGTLESAWFLQALASAGKTQEALTLYAKLCLRARAAGQTPPDFPDIAWAARLHGPAVRDQEGFPERLPDIDPWPAAFAIAWQESVLPPVPDTTRE